MESQALLPIDSADNFFFLIHLTKHKKINETIFVLAVGSRNGINNSLVSEVR